MASCMLNNTAVEIGQRSNQHYTAQLLLLQEYSCVCHIMRNCQQHHPPNRALHRPNKTMLLTMFPPPAAATAAALTTTMVVPGVWKWVLGCTDTPIPLSMHLRLPATCAAVRLLPSTRCWCESQSGNAGGQSGTSMPDTQCGALPQTQAPAHTMTESKTAACIRSEGQRKAACAEHVSPTTASTPTYPTHAKLRSACCMCYIGCQLPDSYNA